MPPTLEELGIDRLSAEDRLALAEAIWESVAREAEQAPLTQNPAAGVGATAGRQPGSPGCGHTLGGGEGASLGEGAVVSLPVVLRDEAQAEFDEAFDYYEGQRAGLGVDFVARVQRVFDRIAANPLLHKPVFLLRCAEVDAVVRWNKPRRVPCRRLGVGICAFSARGNRIYFSGHEVEEATGGK